MNVTTYPTQGCCRGHGRGRGRGRGHFGNHGGYSKNSSCHLKWDRNEKKIEKDKGDSNKNSMERSCYHCRMKGHWSRTYRTLKHFVELYQESLKGMRKTALFYFYQFNLDSCINFEFYFYFYFHLAFKFQKIQI